MSAAATDLSAAIAARPGGLHDVPLGLYVYVPFCARRCGYCAFTTYALGDGGDHATQERYVAAAVAELAVADRALGARRPALTSVYFGGGTPTMLTDDQFERLLRAVRDRFELRPDLEVTVESNPDGLRPGQLAAWHAFGATRVSFGLQSTSRRVLRTLDRTHDPERALSAVGEARSAGFEHVSLDLIHGTPGETPGDWTATLDAAIASGADHLSAYALGVEDGTKLAARVRGGALARPDPDEAAERYLVAEERLASAGVEWYELSNWARSPAGRSRHNLLYWRDHHWWGIGPGAHSHLAGLRWWNHDGLDRWASDATCGTVPAAGYEVLRDDQRRLESVMLGIRLAEGLPVSTPHDRAGAARLVEDELLERRGDRLVLTVAGRLLADHVVRVLAC